MTTKQNREPFIKATPTHLALSRRAVTALLTALACVGLILAPIGLADAYNKVGGTDTREGIVITVAIVVAVLTVVGVLTYSAVLVRRSRKQTTAALAAGHEALGDTAGSTVHLEDPRTGKPMFALRVKD